MSLNISWLDVYMIMEPADERIKVYTSYTKKVLKNGQIKYYPTQKRYTIVGRPHVDIPDTAVDEMKQKISSRQRIQYNE